MKNIVLITDWEQEYYYWPFLAEAEKTEDLKIYLFIQKDYPRKNNASITSKNGGLCGYIEVFDPSSSEYRKLRLDEISVAWYLRPLSPKCEDKSLSAYEIKFIEAESRYTLLSIYDSVEWKWVNSKRAIDKITNNKFFQQKIAHKNGFLTPHTIISNNSEEICLFLGDREDVLLKTICPTEYKNSEGEYLFVYSEMVNKDLLLRNARRVNASPLYAQYYIDKKFEYRVTIAGKNVLACRIYSQDSQKTKVDWRHYDFEKVKHEAVHLPTVLKDKLLNLMEEMNLHFGAVDLIEDIYGNFYFLEVNPSGQWDWVNQLAKLDIPKKVIEMLLNL